MLALCYRQDDACYRAYIVRYELRRVSILQNVLQTFCLFFLATVGFGSPQAEALAAKESPVEADWGMSAL